MLDRKDHSHPKTPRDYLRLFLTGFAMGAADLVPGVSGGTMAFILGIYEDLLNAIKSFNFHALRLALGLKFKELLEHIPLRFLIALGLGIGTAILLLSNALSTTLADPVGRVLLFAFFFGLVIASILAVWPHVRWSAPTFVALAIGTIVAFVIVNLTPAFAEPAPLNLFIAGMIAICAMILPGISGSFILLIMGHYDNVLNAVSNRDFVTVGIVAVGCAVGIVIFSRVLSWLLKRQYQITVAALIGFMIGSLWKVWPWKECVVSDLDRHGDLRCLQEMNLLPQPGADLALAVGLMIVGFVVVSFLDHLQSGRNPLFSLFWRRTPAEAAAD
jgi:putative membrane protein